MSNNSINPTLMKLFSRSSLAVRNEDQSINVEASLEACKDFVQQVADLDAKNVEPRKLIKKQCDIAFDRAEKGAKLKRLFLDEVIRENPSIPRENLDELTTDVLTYSGSFKGVLGKSGGYQRVADIETSHATSDSESKSA